MKGEWKQTKPRHGNVSLYLPSRLPTHLGLAHSAVNPVDDHLHGDIVGRFGNLDHVFRGSLDETSAERTRRRQNHFMRRKYHPVIRSHRCLRVTVDNTSSESQRNVAKEIQSLIGEQRFGQVGRGRQRYPKRRFRVVGNRHLDAAEFRTTVKRVRTRRGKG